MKTMKQFSAKLAHKGQMFVTTRMLPPGMHKFYYTVGGVVE